MPDGVIGGRQGVRVLALGVNWFAAGSGGLDRVFHDLALAFPQAGVDMHGLVLGPPDAAERSFGQVQAFGRGGGLPLRLWQARRAIAAHMASVPTDLVAVHFALFALPALDLLAHRPMVMHFHGPWADEAAAEGAGRLGVACAPSHGACGVWPRLPGDYAFASLCQACLRELRCRSRLRAGGPR